MMSSAVVKLSTVCGLLVYLLQLLGICAGFTLAQVEQNLQTAPSSYAFSFEIKDNATETHQYQKQASFFNGTVLSSWGYYTKTTSDDGLLSVEQKQSQSQQSQTQPAEQEKEQEKPTNRPAAATPAATDAIDEIGPHTLNGINIDLSKDLLSPTLWRTINGTALLNATNENKAEKLGIAPFEKVIPKQFPLVTFELPKDNIHEMEAQEINHKKSQQQKESASTTTPSAKNNDLVTKIVNETRKEFLENVPILL